MRQPKKEIDRFTVFTLLATNAIPLYGVVVGHWPGMVIIALYMIETIIIGVSHGLRMLAYRSFKNQEYDKFKMGAIATVIFFFFHYFMFVFVQSVLLFGFAKGAYPGLQDGFNVFHNYSLFFVEPYMISIYAFMFSQIVYTVREVVTKSYKDLTRSEYMFLPYKRIFVQQFVVIFGAMLFLSLNSVMAIVILLIVLKTGAEYMGLRYGEKWLKPKTAK